MVINPEQIDELIEWLDDGADTLQHAVEPYAITCRERYKKSAQALRQLKMVQEDKWELVEVTKMVMDYCGDPKGISDARRDHLYETALQLTKKLEANNQQGEGE